ncbi:MAG: hypothetical protein BWY59_02118 [Verrucomicrobia bacterium ADurb.Bin345]|nr:MAG: hypothetical protein BWY59_02118 [Verrucomicrobia bacterium ADurb.Bin345]
MQDVGVLHDPVRQGDADLAGGRRVQDHARGRVHQHRKRFRRGAHLDLLDVQREPANDAAVIFALLARHDSAPDIHEPHHGEGGPFPRLDAVNQLLRFRGVHHDGRSEVNRLCVGGDRAERFPGGRGHRHEIHPDPGGARVFLRLPPHVGRVREEVLVHQHGQPLERHDQAEELDVVLRLAGHNHEGVVRDRGTAVGADGKPDHGRVFDEPADDGFGQRLAGRHHGARDQHPSREHHVHFRILQGRAQHLPRPVKIPFRVPGGPLQEGDLPFAFGQDGNLALQHFRDLVEIRGVSVPQDRDLVLLRGLGESRRPDQQEAQQQANRCTAHNPPSDCCIHATSEPRPHARTTCRPRRISGDSLRRCSRSGTPSRNPCRRRGAPTRSRPPAARPRCPRASSPP